MYPRQKLDTVGWCGGLLSYNSIPHSFLCCKVDVGRNRRTLQGVSLHRQTFLILVPCSLPRCSRAVGGTVRLGMHEVIERVNDKESRVARHVEPRSGIEIVR